MTDLPTEIHIHEVGPREGFQFEGIADPTRITAPDKARLVDALSQTGLKRIEVTSFVSPRHVPQMADADEVSALFSPSEDVRYGAVFMNERGLQRAIGARVYDVRGTVTLSASAAFAKRNQNRSPSEDIDAQRQLVAMYAAHGIDVKYAMVVAAFGCNFEGDIPVSTVVEKVNVIRSLAEEYGLPVQEILLADTMGWADPEAIKRVISSVRAAWPGLEVALHLHDTRGTGMANVYAALEAGVARFDSSVAGLGGCPFAGVVGGNVATEDLVFMCHRMGIRTGVDLDAIVDCATLAEEIVGHAVPSRMRYAHAGQQRSVLDGGRA